ncbi:MAG: orotidine-5'-phosphate decarboxylase [Pyrinomonadaceae bacterium]
MPAPTSESKLRPSERIIVALDVETADNAQRIVDELGDSVGGFKIGLQLFTSAGPELVRKLAGKGHRVFLDLKFHDIPNTVAKASVEAARLGAWMFNVHASGGGEMMKRTANKVGEVCERESLTPPKIIAVTVLTSSDNNLLAETGIEGDVENQVVKLAQLTAKYGLDGVVASALEAATIKANVPQPFLVVTPGIRPASATNDDQKRVTTAEEAVLNGADYLVIGRPITQAANKREAALAIANQIPEISDRSPV